MANRKINKRRKARDNVEKGGDIDGYCGVSCVFFIKILQKMRKKVALNIV